MNINASIIDQWVTGIVEKTGLKEKIELTEVGKYNLVEEIILEKNFLASDAEIIAEFVDVNIPRIEGINEPRPLFREYQR